MASSPLLPKETPTTPEVVPGLASFPLIEKIRSSTHEKVSHLLAPLTQIKGWFKEKLQHYLPGFFSEEKVKEKSPPSSASSTTPNPAPDVSAAPPTRTVSDDMKRLFEEAQIAEEDEMKSMAQEFAGLANSYRKKAGLHEVQAKEELHSLAGQVVDLQIQNGKLEHSTDAFRQQQGIQGEILVSGFSSAEEALEKFVNSADHYKNLMGDFKEFGYALRPGLEQSSGERMYYLAVVYRGGKPLESESQVAKPPLTPAPVTSYQNLAEVFEKRPVFKPYFKALDTLLRSQDPEITYEFTDQVHPSEQEQKKGSFAIIVKKGEKKAVYFVSHSPVLLNRVENGKLLQIPFESFVKDFSSRPEKPISSKPVPEDASATPTSQELEQQFDQPSARKGIPEAEQMKEKVPEVVGFS